MPKQYPTYDIHIGIPQILEDRLPNSFCKQSCLPKRRPSVRHTCFTRTVQTPPASAIGQAAEVGHEQQPHGNRRIRRSAIRSVLVIVRSPDTESLGISTQLMALHSVLTSNSCTPSTSPATPHPSPNPSTSSPHPVTPSSASQ
jgi:hypothetical protein